MIVILAPWAGGPDDGRKMRHFFLAEELVKKLDQDIVIFCEGTGSGNSRKSYAQGRITLVYSSAMKVRSRATKKLIRAINMMMYVFSGIFISIKNGRSTESILWVSVPHPGGAIANIIARPFVKAQTIYEIRDPWPELLIQLKIISAESTVAIALKKIDHVMQRAARLIVTVGNENGHVASEYRSKCQILFNGLPDKFVQLKSPDAFSDRLKPLKLIFAGGCANAFRMDLMLAAVKHASEEVNRTIEFNIITSDAEQVMINEEVKRLEISHLVNVSGFVPYEKLLNTIGQNDFYLFHLTDREFFRGGINSNKLNDAFATGTPVLCAATIENNLVKNEQNGLVCWPDSVEELSKMIVKASKMDKISYNILSNNSLHLAKSELSISARSSKIIEVIKLY